MKAGSLVIASFLAASLAQGDELDEALQVTSDTCLLSTWEEKRFRYGGNVEINVSDQDLIVILKVLSGRGAMQRAETRVRNELANNPAMTREAMLEAIQGTAQDCVAKRERFRSR